MHLGAETLEIAGISWEDPLPYEGLRETYLAECSFRGADNRKIQFAILCCAAARGGLEPDLLDEAIWWQTDDFWRCGLLAAVAPPGRTGSGRDRPRRSVDRTRSAGGFFGVGFLAGFLPLNTYWALGGTWGVGWVLGCADCTVPLSVVWIQEALVAAGIGVLLARGGVWRPQLPSWIWRSGTWTMAAAFSTVGAQNLLGDNTTQARLLFAPWL